MCNKYDEIVKCKICYIVIQPNCELHNKFLENYKLETFERQRMNFFETVCYNEADKHDNRNWKYVFIQNYCKDIFKQKFYDEFIIETMKDFDITKKEAIEEYPYVEED
jgi:hypothetical protein